MNGHTVDLAIARLARRQHGVWSRLQAITAGATPAMIRSRLAAGRWIRLDRGVYADAASVPTWRRGVMAAVLAEPWAAASHRSAAVLHELEGFRPGRPELTVRPHASTRGRLALVHRGVDVITTRVDGIRTSSLPQTFVDLAQVVSTERLRPALAAKADVVPTLLGAVRDRYCDLAPRGGRNLGPLRSALESFGAGDLPSPSELEHHLRFVLRDPSIPEVRWEAPFPGRQGDPRRVDALIPEWSTIVEGDGRAWHTRVQDFENDRRRDAEAAAAGFLTLRFTWHQLTSAADWVRGVVIQTGSHRQAA